MFLPLTPLANHGDDENRVSSKNIQQHHFVCPMKKRTREVDTQFNQIQKKQQQHINHEEDETLHESVIHEEPPTPFNCSLGEPPLQDELTHHLQSSSFADELDPFIEKKLLPPHTAAQPAPAEDVFDVLLSTDLTQQPQEEEPEEEPEQEPRQGKVLLFKETKEQEEKQQQQQQQQDVQSRVEARNQYYMPHYLSNFKCYFIIESKEKTKIQVEMSILCRSSTYFENLLKKSTLIESVIFSEEIIRSALYVIEKSWSGGTNNTYNNNQFPFSQLYPLSVWISITEFFSKYISLSGVQEKMDFYFNQILIHAATHGKIKEILQVYNAEIYPSIKKKYQNYLLHESLCTGPQSPVFLAIAKDWKLSQTQYELFDSLVYSTNTCTWEMDFNFLLNFHKSLQIDSLKNIILPSKKPLKQFILETEREFRTHLKTLPENQTDSYSIYNRRWKQIVDFFSYKKYMIPKSKKTNDVFQRIKNL